MGMLKIPEWVPDEIRLVLLCRAIRRLQRKRGLSFEQNADLIRLQHMLDKELAQYDSDAAIRGIRS
jgi:hypothetical protein